MCTSVEVTAVGYGRLFERWSFDLSCENTQYSYDTVALLCASESGINFPRSFFPSLGIWGEFVGNKRLWCFS